MAFVLDWNVITPEDKNIFYDFPLPTETILAIHTRGPSKKQKWHEAMSNRVLCRLAKHMTIEMIYQFFIRSSKKFELFCQLKVGHKMSASQLKLGKGACHMLEIFWRVYSKWLKNLKKNLSEKKEELHKNLLLLKKADVAINQFVEEIENGLKLCSKLKCGKIDETASETMKEEKSNEFGVLESLDAKVPLEDKAGKTIDVLNRDKYLLFDEIYAKKETVNENFDRMVELCKLFIWVVENSRVKRPEKLKSLNLPGALFFSIRSRNKYALAKDAKRTRNEDVDLIKDVINLE